MIIKNILKLSFVFVLLFSTTSCDKDEYYDDEGSYEVINISSTPSADSEFFYDASSTQSVNINVTASTEGTPTNIVVQKRINDGEWIDHATLSSVPADLVLSLDEALDGTGFSLVDLSTSDVIEIGYLINGEFRNGLTTVPIVCSTDITLSNVSSDIFNSDDGDQAAFSFDVAKDGPGNLETADINVSYNGGDVTLVKNVVVPGSYTVTLSETAAALGIDPASIELADEFAFTYLLNSAGGIKCPSALSDVLPYQCPSDLSGTYTYTNSAVWCDEGLTSGELTLSASAPGVYDVSDWSIGGYTSCYGGPAANWGSLKLTDVCNKIAVTGADSYGDDWTYTIDAVSGSDLTITWLNTYGEGGTATLTRTDGTDWPALTN